MVEYSLDLQNMNFTAIRTVRVLRPLKAINRVPSKLRRHIGLHKALFTRLQGGCTNEIKYCTDKLIYRQLQQHDANTKPIIRRMRLKKNNNKKKNRHYLQTTQWIQCLRRTEEAFNVQTVKPTEAMWLWFGPETLGAFIANHQHKLGRVGEVPPYSALKVWKFTVKS